MGNPEGLKEEKIQLKEFFKRADVKAAFLKYEQRLKSNFLCITKQEANKTLPQNAMTLEGFIKSQIKANILPNLLTLEDSVITFKQVMSNRPKDEAKDRPALKASPVNNMLLFTEFKLALVRQLFYA